jgi:protein O-mannosyl-transferase
MLASKSTVLQRFCSPIGLGVGLFVVSVALYANTFAHDFVWDDIYLILEDHTVKSFRYLGDIFTSDFFGHQEDDLVYGYYRPVVSLSYVVDYAIWQENPFGYHLTNTLLHAVATVLVLVALLKMRMEKRPAFFGALLFAVHPMHTESVAWISGRTDLVAFVFAIIAFIAHISAGHGVRRTVMKALAYLSFALALMAKETSITVVLWMAVCDVALFHKRWSQLANALLPYGAVVSIYLVWRFAVIDVEIPAQSPQFTTLDAVISAPWTIARYLSWLVFPHAQSAWVKNPYISGIGDVRLYVGVAVVSALAYLLYRLRRTSPLAVAFGVMLAVSFFPILNLIQVTASRDLGNSIFERFLYFPSFPFVALVALVFHLLWARIHHASAWRAAFGLAVFVIATVLAVATVSRNRVWKNNEVFYRTTIEESSASAWMWSNLVSHYIHTDQWDKAKEALVELQRFFPEDYHSQSALALWHLTRKEYDKAIALQQKVAQKVKRGRAVAYNNLALLYRVTGDYDRARALLEEIIHNKRAYADVYFNLAEVHRATGSPAAALKNYRKALARRPDNIQMAGALAGTLIQMDELDEAAMVCRAQLEMHRDNPGLLNNLGVVYQKKREPKRAKALFEKSLEQDPAYVKARFNLATVLLALKQKDEATKHLERIVRKHGKTQAGEAARRLLDDGLK